MVSPVLWAIFVLVIIIVTVSRKRTHTQAMPMPPGPPADPVLGHLRILPSVRQERVYQKWAAEYGPVFRLYIPGQSIIVLNTIKPAIDLLERRSSIYSDRPQCALFELQGWYPILTFLQYGPMWRKHRKLIHERFTIRECPAYQPIQLQEAAVLLRNLLMNPSDFSRHVQRFAAAITADITYGHRVVSNDDEVIEFAEQGSVALAACGHPAASLLDFFPMLKHVPYWMQFTPGISWIFEPIHTHRQKIKRTQNEPIKSVRREIASGTARPSFTSAHLEDVDDNETHISDIEIEDIAGAAHAIFIGATETTWSTVLTFILAMVLFPEVQRIAQEEIDRVVGIRRLPDFTDRESLPYLECVLEETMRFHPTVPLGAPHKTTEDDTYEGMFIPKGSQVIANLWAMCHDKNVYKHPEEFRPERFLPRPAGFGEAHLDAMNFGFGRRICPGRRLADASVWIAITTILATFDITKAVRQDGTEITPELAFASSLVSGPLPFDCSIIPRSSQAEALVNQMSFD